MKDRVLEEILNHGALLEPEAADYILSQDDPMGYVKGLLDRKDGIPLFLSVDFLRSVGLSVEDPSPTGPMGGGSATSKNVATDAVQAVLSTGPVFGRRRAPRNTDGGFHVISDITGNSTTDGSIEDFTRYFRHRYRVLRRIIRGHVEMGGVTRISEARNMGRDVKIIGMVMDVSRTKNGHLGVTVEDDTGEIFVLIHKDSELIDSVILKDEVLGFVGKVVDNSRREGGKKYRRDDNGMFIPKSIHWPSVPASRTQRRSREDMEVIFMSDIHTGSTHFLPDAWDRFIEWLGTEDAARVRYIVVAGDLVDGIGVYPNQQDELDITDIHEQYRELARLMSPIPESIRVIMQPGNHDAVRPAEPQPALAEGFREMFGPNYTFVGNPCHFSISGVEILSYHGRSIDDLVASIPEIRYQDPIPPMLTMLKRRHLAVSYGVKTPLSPEIRDYMVINPVPDIFVTGHVHRTAVHQRGGLTLINSSAWQSQTPFQRMHNFHPDPGKVVVVNLKSGRCRVKDFA